MRISTVAQLSSPQVTRSPSWLEQMPSGADSSVMVGRNSMRNNKLIVMVCTNLANLCCHAVYSVLASFFPQEAKAKGMSDDMVGFVFAVFAAIIFVW